MRSRFIAGIAVGALWAFPGVASPLSAQAWPSPCGTEAPVTVRGLLLDREGGGISRARIRVQLQMQSPTQTWLVDGCSVYTDEQGGFALHGARTPLVLWPDPLAICADPVVVVPGAEESPLVRIEGHYGHDPLSDRQFVVHGWPWVPPTYEEARCAFDRTYPTNRELRDRIPTPDDALARVLDHPESADVLQLAARAHEVVPVMYHYGPLGAPPPPGPVPYALDGDRAAGFLYVIVLHASPTVMRAQIGYVDRAAYLTRGDDERGLRIEWQYAGAGWDAGTVLERWEPRPRGLPEPLTPSAVDLMSAAVEAALAGVPDGATLCLRMTINPDEAPIPERMLQTLTTPSRSAVRYDACPPVPMPPGLDAPPEPILSGSDDDHYVNVSRPSFRDAGLADFVVSVIHGPRFEVFRCSVDARGGAPRGTCEVSHASSRW